MLVSYTVGVSVTCPDGLTGEALDAYVRAYAIKEASESEDVHADDVDVLYVRGVDDLLKRPVWPPPEGSICTLRDGSRWASDGGAMVLNVDACTPPAELRGRRWSPAPDRDMLTSLLAAPSSKGGKPILDAIGWDARYAPVLTCGTVTRLSPCRTVAIVERDGSIVALLAAHTVGGPDGLVGIDGKPLPSEGPRDCPHVAGARCADAESCEKHGCGAREQGAQPEGGSDAS